MGAHDLVLAGRLAREARAGAVVQQRAARAHARALARRERVLRRARRDLPRAGAVALAATGANLVMYGADGTPLLWGVAGAAAVRAYRAAVQLRRPPAVPALAAPPAPPPRPGTPAFAAVSRLEEVRRSFERLLPLVAPPGREVADEAVRAAASADASLRWTAARMAAVEPHRGPDAELHAQLEGGVAAQERLLAGLVDLVAASADPLATYRLQDATDRLHGLAAGLREVRSGEVRSGEVR